ncbi:MAG: glycosyltransferase family 4 protein [Pseudomonadota bacterium]|nr:glycosyltransferase family 4 protein [Pseudomonadota bacterium]
MKKVAILVDLELSKIAGGHVKFWEKVCESIKDTQNHFHLTVFFLGIKETKKKISNNIDFICIKPILSSKILRSLGVDADYTDLFPFNFKLFLILRKFDIIHSTDQLFSMARTAIYASKVWKKPLTTSLHTDTPSYSEYYIKKIFSKLPSFFKYIFINKIKLHKKVPKTQRRKITNYLEYCKYGMINDHLSTDEFKFSSKLKNKICKLSRGVDTKIFRRKHINRLSLLRKYKINDREKIIFFCGRIHELKGAIFLCKVNKILNERKIRVVSIFAGEDIHGKECKNIGGTRIKVIGHIDQNEVSDLYNLCDLFVFPSKYEIGPQVVLEAKSCGAISVVHPDGGGKRISENGVDGIIITEYKHEVWADEIANLLRNKRRRNLMKKKILAKYRPPSWNEIFERYFSSIWIKL